MKLLGVSEREARDAMARNDNARTAYVRHFYRCDPAEAAHYHLVIDMEAVEFLDSTGLGVLVGGLKKVRAHDGSLELVCNQDRLLKIFKITGLAKVFVIHDALPV